MLSLCLLFSDIATVFKSRRYDGSDM